MREYRRIRKIISWFLAAYFAGGLLTLMRPEMEVFPVYSWFLFALVPQSGPQYGLLLHNVNGRSIEPPRLYQEAGDWISTSHSVTAFKLTQELGAAVEKNLPEKLRDRELLEKNWLPPRTSYELIKLNADPITRWKTGKYEITQTLGTFANADGESEKNR
ncbi:MAG TPA: hypothetical protein VG754_00470 [Verrucomicrobiae bacterium]|nr:hypothetical protein [Verrucomicrobiae bacterium]